MKKLLLLLNCLLPVFFVSAQQGPAPTIRMIPLKAICDLRPEKDLWMPMLKNQQLPKPHSGAERETVRHTKQMLDQQYRSRRIAGSLTRQTAANAPVLISNFIGNFFNYYVPNDNDLAVSDSGFVASVSNTTIFSKNTVTNQTYGLVTLHSLVASLGLTMEEFDPKVLYDPGSDRFVITFLNGFNDTTSNIIVGFSQGNTTAGLWNFYTLPGDPLNNSLWTDFPMISVSDKELFITVNLLYNDSSWQTGFNQTIIWQINKENGYQGQTLTTQLHTGMQFNGSWIRNLCPVKGGSGNYGPGAWFLSNRNFSAGNDTLFLVHITDTIGSPSQLVNIQALTSPLQYRMPVDADQLGTTERLIVNDARVMGAFIQDDRIQFVMTVLDTVSGYNGIYHGVIDSVSVAPQVTADLYTVPNTDVAYPNISYAGTSPGDQRAVFGYLYSSPIVYPGTAAAAWDGSSFSSQVLIRAGGTPCNMLIGDERWGDYTGCQTRYNQPGHVWVNGSYTVFGGVTRTWVGELTVTTAAGVATPDEYEKSLLYPNPAVERAAIRFNKPATGRITITIVDQSGKTIHRLFYGSVVAGENEISFKTEALPPGIYHVIITEQNGNQLVRERLVKQ